MIPRERSIGKQSRVLTIGRDMRRIPAQKKLLMWILLHCRRSGSSAKARLNIDHPAFPKRWIVGTILKNPFHAFLHQNKFVKCNEDGIEVSHSYSTIENIGVKEGQIRVNLPWPRLREENHEKYEIELSNKHQFLEILIRIDEFLTISAWFHNRLSSTLLPGNVDKSGNRLFAWCITKTAINLTDSPWGWGSLPNHSGRGWTRIFTPIR
jgi:hypothetical protein